MFPWFREPPGREVFGGARIPGPMAGMLSMSCSACGRTVFAADAGGLAAGVRRHVEAVCPGTSEPVSPAVLEAMRRLRGEAAVAVS